MKDPTIEMTEVKGSSNIAAMGYDKETSTMRVRFHGGREYDYHGVPLAIFQRVCVSESVGRAFIRDVRKAYDGRRVGQQ
jgi:hypothetical protein